jgi:DNA-binding NarL/FixJ family response regulator
MVADFHIKVAIADDHKIFRDGIKTAVNAKDNLKILWEADNGKDMLHKLEVRQPDILLMDIRMPELDGFMAISMVKKEFPRVKVIVLSMYDDEQTVSKMMELGANAFLNKVTDPNEIFEAIETCMADEFYFNDIVNNAMMGKLMQRKNVRQNFAHLRPVNFTEKEIKIIELISQDHTAEDIAKQIFLSPRTIETIRQNLKAKANVKTIGGLVMYAVKNKLIPVGTSE